MRVLALFSLGLLVCGPVLAQVPGQESRTTAMCGSRGALSPCDDQWDGGADNRALRVELSRDWADSVAALGEDEFGLPFVPSCRACTKAAIDSSTQAYAEALRIRYQERPKNLAAIPRLSDEDLGWGQAALFPPALPLQISLRESLLQSMGLVLQMRNTTDQDLHLQVTLANPATAERRIFEVRVPASGMAEFGHLEGWKILPGHTIELLMPGYEPYVRRVN